MQQRNYDAVVIGSGVGGMCAGALLVHEGYKTLVVESRDRLGGRFSTEEVEGFKLVTGASLIHHSGWVPRVFKKVGATLELRDCFEVSYWIRGDEHYIPMGNRVAALFDLINKMEVDRVRLVGGIAKEVATQKIQGALGRAISQPDKESGPTFREWLLRYTDNEDVHAVFDSMCVSFLLAHSYEIPARSFFHFMATEKGAGDGALCPQGNLSAVQELARVVETNGDTWTDCPAKRIVVAKGAATGVVVEHTGREVEIACKAVISNAGPRQTVALAGSENFDAGYLAQMRVKLRASPVVIIHVASDEPLCLEGGEHGGMLVAGARRITGAIPLTNTCPELAPPGKHLLHLVATPATTLAAMDAEEEIRQCTLDLEMIFPDFQKKNGRILKMEPRNIDHDLPLGRTWNGPPFRMPRETPVKNLWNVGDAAYSAFGGTSGCAETAMAVVEAVKQSVGH
ncbi:MAG: NAD(P)/FAD-dependent oxidoreductase [Deltaproteobacteria bacterium]|nr:NAD(P)/FAD-dependent oxidoreductase [Deltaproteobacteria bacterium]